MTVSGESHPEDQVVDVHLLLCLHDLDDEAVDVVPLPLQRAGRVLVHVQVGLLGQQVAVAAAIRPLGEGLLV